MRKKPIKNMKLITHKKLRYIRTEHPEGHDKSHHICFSPHLDMEGYIAPEGEILTVDTIYENIALPDDFPIGIDIKVLW